MGHRHRYSLNFKNDLSHHGHVHIALDTGTRAAMLLGGWSSFHMLVSIDRARRAILDAFQSHRHFGRKRMIRSWGRKTDLHDPWFHLRLSRCPDGIRLRRKRVRRGVCGNRDSGKCQPFVVFPKRQIEHDHKNSHPNIDPLGCCIQAGAPIVPTTFDR